MKITWSRFWLLRCLVLSICCTVIGQTYTLRDALLKAANNNSDIKTEEIKLGYTKADLASARMRPNLLLNQQFLQLMDRQFMPDPSKPFARENHQVWYQLTKPMQLGRQHHKRVELARQGGETRTQEWQEKRRQIFYEVGTLWLNLWFHKIELTNLMEAKHNVDTLDNINKKRLASGLIPPIEALRTSLLVEQYELQLMNIRQYYADDVNDLKTYLNSNDSMDVDIRMSIQVVPLMETEDSLIQYALSHRPDISMLRSQQAASKFNLKLQKAMRSPFMELGVVYNPQNGIKYGGTFATIGVPVFSRNQGGIQAAQVSIREHESALNAQIVRVKNEVRKAFQTYQNNRKIMERFFKILEDSRGLLKNISNSYLKGNTAVFDFLEAQRSYLNTQELYYEALLNYRRSYLELIYVTSLINNVQ